MKKIDLKIDCIFILAVLASLIWHAFWLSAVKIVAPGRNTSVRFSKIAFLGPILTKGAVEVRMAARPDSFLEKRYFETALRSYSVSGITGADRLPACEASYSKFHMVTSAESAALVDEAFGSKKLEPSELY